MLCLASAPLAAWSADEALDPVDRFVTAEMQRQTIPGAAVAVIRHGQVVKARGYGSANLEWQVPVGDDSMFEVASITKQFTAVAIMLLVEDGRLSLDDHLTRFFPDAPAWWGSITLRQMLTHTAGIDNPDGPVDDRRDYTEDELVHLAYGQRRMFPAGTRASYCNTCFDLLGVIVHKASGQPYGEFLAARVFGPLGMSTARVLSYADLVPHRAAGYRLDDKGGIENKKWEKPTPFVGAGGLLLSLKDFIAWDAGIGRRALLTPAGWAQVFAPVRLNSGHTLPIGFGWSIQTRGGQPAYAKDGRAYGFGTFYARYLAGDLDVIMMVNQDAADTMKMVEGIATLLEPRLVRPAARPIADAEPAVTAELTDLLAKARAGRLPTDRFGYMQGRFFAEIMSDLQKQLDTLGPLHRLALLEHDKALDGDDRVYFYRAEFANGTQYLVARIAPNGQFASFRLQEEPFL